MCVSYFLLGFAFGVSLIVALLVYEVYVTVCYFFRPFFQRFVTLSSMYQCTSGLRISNLFFSLVAWSPPRPPGLPLHYFPRRRRHGRRRRQRRRRRWRNRPEAQQGKGERRPRRRGGEHAHRCGSWRRVRARPRRGPRRLERRRVVLIRARWGGSG